MEKVTAGAETRVWNVNVHNNAAEGWSDLAGVRDAVDFVLRSTPVDRTPVEMELRQLVQVVAQWSALQRCHINYTYNNSVREAATIFRSPLQVDFWPFDLESCPSYVWRGLPLCQF